LTEISNTLKNYETENSIISDLINEIENKINLTRNIVDQEKEVQKIINQNEDKPELLEKGYHYATYNKYDDDDEDEYPRMTSKWMNKFLCSNFKLYYRTHELNECLYLHFKGFRQIENLDSFVNLKVLYLEGNSIKKIQGLSKLVNLSSLYLHQNLIEKIEGLDDLTNLYNLNLSDNCISKIENLQNLQRLSNLLLKGNKIGIDGLDDLIGLKNLSSTVSVVDIANNKIDDANLLTEILVHIPGLKVLYLQGNECIRKIAHYRKTFISNLLNLTYLDDKPVFEDERRFAEAFSRGGLEEEKRERALYKKEKEDAELQRLKDFREMIENWKGEAKKSETETYTEVKSDKEKEEDRKNMLIKLKNRNTLQEAKQDGSINLIIKEEAIDSDIFCNNAVVDSNSTVIPTASNESIIDHNYLLKSANINQSELPDLETVKTLNETGYIDYFLEKENYNQENTSHKDFNNISVPVSLPVAEESHGIILSEKASALKQQENISNICNNNFDEVD